MNTNNNNINNINHDLDMIDLVMGLTTEEFFELVPQPPLTSSGYSLHFPPLEADDFHISSSDSEEEEEEMESGNNNNNISHFENVGCCTTNEEPDDEDNEDDDFALYEKKRCIRNEDIPMDISDSESDDSDDSGEEDDSDESEEEEEDEDGEDGEEDGEDVEDGEDGDIPMDISDSEEDDEEEDDDRAVPLQRSVSCDGGSLLRPRFQELEEGEIDESNLVYLRQVTINSSGCNFDDDTSAWELDEVEQAEHLVDDEFADLPDLIPMEVEEIDKFKQLREKRKFQE